RPDPHQGDGREQTEEEACHLAPVEQEEGRDRGEVKKEALGVEHRGADIVRPGGRKPSPRGKTTKQAEKSAGQAARSPGLAYYERGSDDDERQEGAPTPRGRVEASVVECHSADDTQRQDERA